jgi:hypothetical protein
VKRDVIDPTHRRLVVLRTYLTTRISRAAAGAALAGLLMPLAASATEPCDDFGECKVLIEINASDGDIGFHWLADGDELNSTRIRDPDNRLIYDNKASGPLREQKLTETFGESAEPLCWPDPEADPEDLEGIVTLEEFLERWTEGTYVFGGKGDEGETLFGETDLTYLLPAAPADVDFDGAVISWAAGDDLGNCASNYELDMLVMYEVLPQHPENVTVDAYEVVFEPDVEDGDPLGNLKYTIRVPGDISPKAVTVPADYLASLPDDTPVKIEVGAIGGEDNATFTEAAGFCVNENEGCD